MFFWKMFRSDPSFFFFFRLFKINCIIWLPGSVFSFDGEAEPSGQRNRWIFAIPSVRSCVVESFKFCASVIRCAERGLINLANIFGVIFVELYSISSISWSYIYYVFFILIVLCIYVKFLRICWNANQEFHLPYYNDDDVNECF